MAQWIESEFNSYDGLTLFYRYCKPATNNNNALIFLHRGHEHSGRIVSFADKLSQDNYWCFAFDLRGHGLSQGRRAWAADFESWVKDLNSFVGHIRAAFGINIKESVLIANSVGSVMALRWILNYGPDVKGCILGAPAFSIKLYIPFALPFLRLVSKFSQYKFVTSYVRSSLLTRDEKEAQTYDSDHLITKKIGVNVLVSLFDASKNCFQRLEDFETPVLVFTAENDHIVHNRTHTQFYRRISSKIKKHILLKGFRHAVFHEMEQDKIIEPARKFLTTLFFNNGKQLPAVVPQARLHTLQEYKELHGKASLVKQVYYFIYRSLLKRLGQYSNGISIGLRHGFDSGLSLDYVYQNKPSGKNLLGKQVDRIYLNAVGWKGIRVRKHNLKTTLLTITDMLHSDGRIPVILDVASGPGRYLFEIQQQQNFPIFLHLNDTDENAIKHAKHISAQYQKNNASYSNTNVFKTFNARDFSKVPNIIVVSGLFELYANNQQVHQVVSNLYDLLEEGGYLMYTGQPWHPQLEMIGRTLNNRNGQRWIMRRRLQSEMDQLVESAGFTKLGTESDGYGIFTVSCAQKL